MNQLQTQKTLSFFLIAVILMVAAYAIDRINDLSKEIEQLSINSNFEYYLSNNKEVINAHIQLRINAFIDDEKKKRVDDKFTSYENASEHTVSGKHIYGNENTRFTLVVFSDIECPYCKKYHSTPKSVVDKYPEHVNWQYKHFPLGSQNPNAVLKAIAAECAAEIGGNRAFWVYLQQMMDGQGQGVGGLQLIADNIGLDTRKFVSCLKSGKHEKTINEHIEKAKALGVNSTPITFLIDNHTGKKIMLRGMVAENSVISALQKLKQISDMSLNETKNQKTSQKGNI